MTSFTLRTSQRSEMIDITDKIAEAARDSGVTDGMVTVFVPHTTAGVTINENADPTVVRDILSTLDKLVPRDAGYMHGEGNSDSHIKASMTGSSVQVIVEGGRIALGTWQGIYFCEFDGPRSRKVWVSVQSG